MVTHCQCRYRCRTTYRCFLISLYRKIYVNIIPNLNVWVCMTLAFLCIPVLRPCRRGLLTNPTIALCVQHLPPFLRNLSGNYGVQKNMSLGPHTGPDECNPCSLAPNPQHLLYSHPPKYAGSSEWSLPFIFSNQKPDSVFFFLNLFHASNMSYLAESSPCSWDQASSHSVSTSKRTNLRHITGHI